MQHTVEIRDPEFTEFITNVFEVRGQTFVSPALQKGAGLSSDYTLTGTGIGRGNTYIHYDVMGDSPMLTQEDFLDNFDDIKEYTTAGFFEEVSSPHLTVVTVETESKNSVQLGGVNWAVDQETDAFMMFDYSGELRAITHRFNDRWPEIYESLKDHLYVSKPTYTVTPTGDLKKVRYLQTDEIGVSLLEYHAIQECRRELERINPGIELAYIHCDIANDIVSLTCIGEKRTINTPKIFGDIEAHTTFIDRKSLGTTLADLTEIRKTEALKENEFALEITNKAFGDGYRTGGAPFVKSLAMRLLGSLRLNTKVGSVELIGENKFLIVCYDEDKSVVDIILKNLSATKAH